MPRFEELPITAQNEIRQARGEEMDEHPQRQRLSLLQRLANVGLGRRDEETEAPIQGRSSAPAMPMQDRMPRQAQPAQHRAADPVSEYARRAPPMPQAGHAGLDPHGRPAPVATAPSDDHLDIPAFLRRQTGS